eukprot:CAMPEP_0206509484 /NCGR_PEP_ID=MMETSP0324_2-20121206/58951_1 /ASSEMBLY_ACC=CAM_ASM_000836 /TAXON_ID=2866 /ORGANISM="Crypthecodinium cohnii, Strain Seligo" /LENGTH=107 /DNA_ID=CAMNT_0054000539 /DNA_START=357 /DNA_END=677 /DNA_ORIENTATION=+
MAKSVNSSTVDDSLLLLLLLLLIFHVIRQTPMAFLLNLDDLQHRDVLGLAIRGNDHEVADEIRNASSQLEVVSSAGSLLVVLQVAVRGSSTACLGGPAPGPKVEDDA